MQSPTNFQIPSPGVTSQATWSGTPTPAKCAPYTALTTLAPFSWLHKELLLPPSNGVGRLSHWPPASRTSSRGHRNYLNGGPDCSKPCLSPLLTCPSTHTLDSTAPEGFSLSQWTTDNRHSGMARRVGGRQVHTMQPLCPACSLPRDVTSSTSWRGGILFRFKLPQVFPKSPWQRFQKVLQPECLVAGS